MTFLEKWKLDYPGNDLVDVPTGCPADYGYEIRAIRTKHEGECYILSELRCYNCWRREISMKEKEADRTTEYNIPSRYGYWQVSTEGDEEGKSIRNLGVFHGNIDEIAFALVDKAYYSLNFRLIDPENIPVPKEYKTKIDIYLDLKDVPYGDSNARVSIMREMLAGTNISVEKSNNTYGGVTLYRPEDPDRIKEAKITTVLNKLTDEEKELLRDYFDPSLD